MRLEVIDFPSDPNCELIPRTREVLCKSLQRAAESKDACAKFREVLTFTVGKLKEAEAGHDAAAVKAVAKELAGE